MKIDRQKIEVLMVKQGLTVTKYAERIGVSRQNVSTIFTRGTCNPQTAAKLCEGLNCSIDDIIPTESEAKT